MVEGQLRRLTPKEYIATVAKKIIGAEAYQRAIQKGKTKGGALFDGTMQFLLPFTSENIKRIGEKCPLVFGDSWLGIGIPVLVDVGCSAATIAMALNNLLVEGVAIKGAVNANAVVGTTRMNPSR